MGGFGAINIGMKYPEIFGYVYSMNPGLFNEDGLEKAIFFNEDETQIKEQCKILDKFLIDDEKLINIRFKRLLNSVTMLQSYGMAFSYTDKIPYYELPFKIVDGKIIKEEEIPHEMRPNSGDHGNLIKERMTKYMFPYFSENLKF